MHIEGKISYVGPVQSGTSQRGTKWQKQEFAVTYQDGRYPLAILLPTMDANIIGKLQIGQQVMVDFDCEVRPYSKDGKERMFNNFSIWHDGLRFIGQTSAANTAPTQQQSAQTAQPQQTSQPAQQQSEQLPF